MFKEQWCGGAKGHWADAATFRRVPGRENKNRKAVCEQCYQKIMAKMKELRAQGFTG